MVPNSSARTASSSAIWFDEQKIKKGNTQRTKIVSNH